MAKNSFKKIIKEFECSTSNGCNLIIEKQDEYYYICNGILMLEVSERLYREYFMTQKNRLFVELENNSCIKYSGVMTDKGTETRWKAFLDEEKKKVGKDVVFTNILLGSENKGRFIRLAKIGESTVGCFNELYYQALNDLMSVHKVVCRSNGNRSVMIFEESNGAFSGIVMPVRYFDRGDFKQMDDLRDLKFCADNALNV